MREIENELTDELYLVLSIDLGNELDYELKNKLYMELRWVLINNLETI